MRLHSLFFSAALIFSMSNAAQAQTPTVPQAQTRARTAEACLAPLLARLQTALRLLGETQGQLDATDAQVQRDAAQAVVSLEQRIDAIGEAIRGCVPREARLEPATQERALTGTAARVGQANNATMVLERDIPLVANVRVVVGERVDGSGTAPANLVKRAVRGIGGELQQCYARFLERGALEPGRAIIAFTVTPSGRLSRISVEGVTIQDRPFYRCLRRAANRMRIGGGARGGDARYAYTLRFGP